MDHTAIQSEIHLLIEAFDMAREQIADDENAEALTTLNEAETHLHNLTRLTSQPMPTAARSKPSRRQPKGRP